MTTRRHMPGWRPNTVGLLNPRPADLPWRYLRDDAQVWEVSRPSSIVWVGAIGGELLRLVPAMQLRTWTGYLAPELATAWIDHHLGRPQACRCDPNPPKTSGEACAPCRILEGAQ